jgi:hypothetical protein
VDAQTGAPEHDDQRAQPLPVAALAGGAHDRDDLLHLRWVGRVPAAFVARRATGMEARRGRR